MSVVSFALAIVFIISDKLLTKYSFSYEKSFGNSVTRLIIHSVSGQYFFTIKSILLAGEKLD